MKKRVFKNFIHVLLFGSLLVMACSKKNEPATSPVKEEEDPATEQPADVFTPQTPGITAQTVSGNIGNVKEYLQYIPDTYNEKKTYKWPLVIFLHGIGEIGTDVNVLKNVGLVKVAKGKQFVIVAPQCTSSWWNTNVLQDLFKEVVKKYHVDTNRIYLTGMSMGGYGSWDWSEHYPQQFAAVVPICGAGTVNMACNLKNVPVWAFHNADDPTVNVQNSRDMVNAIKACGGTLIKYTENPGGGHNAWTKAYADSTLYDWMLKQAISR